MAAPKGYSTVATTVDHLHFNHLVIPTVSNHVVTVGTCAGHHVLSLYEHLRHCVCSFGPITCNYCLWLAVHHDLYAPGVIL